MATIKYAEELKSASGLTDTLAPGTIGGLQAWEFARTIEHMHPQSAYCLTGVIGTNA